MKKTSLEHMLAKLKKEGWMVAVHNDYHLSGEWHTFWLFTKGHYAIKGEGTSNEVALERVMAELAFLNDELEIQMREAFEKEMGNAEPRQILFRKGGCFGHEDKPGDEYADGNMQHKWLFWQKCWKVARGITI